MKNILIIGAGIAGLSAGIYARRNGYQATIYESHYLPGGMCTAWKRNGYTFEGCMHYVGLLGASPRHTFYQQWRELGVLPQIEIIRHPIFHTFQDGCGRTFNLYTDMDRLAQEMRALSPQDAAEIEALSTAVKRYTAFTRTTGLNPFQCIAKYAQILAAIPLLKKYGDLNMGEYAARFKDPLIRTAFADLFGSPDFACTNIFFFLAANHMKATGFPQGGSLAFARVVERKFLELGGKIEYRRRVARIQVQDNRATGIVLEDGTLAQADIIISAADGHAILFDLLEDQYTPPALRERYATQPLYPPFIQVSLGVNRDMTGLPHAVKVHTAAPFQIAGQTRGELWYQHYAFDPSLAPVGKTALTVLYPSELAWWENLGYHTPAYQAEKDKILAATLAQLEKILPGIAAQIETRDVATPFTTRRYVNNWQAGLGFMMTKTLAGEMVMNPQYTLPGLGGFYMIGLWVKGFGVPMAAASGKEVIQAICKAQEVKFKAG